jgi:tetratricopeptide (TPR) repeat protein
VLAGLAWLAASADAQQGQVRYLNREREVKVESGVTVVSETLAEVKVKRGSSDRSFKSLDVLEVVYGPGSEAYEQGLAALAAGEWNNAVNLLARAAEEDSPPWQAPVALLRQAEAESLRPDGAADARATLDAFLQRHPEHRRLPEALLLRARLAGVAGDPDQAKADADRVRQLAQSRTLHADWGVEAGLVLGEARLAAGDVRSAREAFTEAERGANLAAAELTERPDLVRRVEQLALSAQVGIGSCLLASDDIAGARTYYERLLRDNPGNPAVLAAAGNGLAECDFRAGGRLKEAQLGFARVAVMAAATPGEQARALYHLGRCADALGAEGKEPDGRRKASEYYQLVQQHFPDTRWAQLAAQALP